MANASIMNIEIIGSGCAKCKKLHELTKAAAAELGLQTEIAYSTAIEKIVMMGVMSSPVLAVNGRPVLVGSVPDIQTIKKLLSEHTKQKAEKEGCCSGKDCCGIDCSPKNQPEGGGCSCGSC
ncbi:MAG: thioredoxin family protein [Candidatus Peribacteraceae bacterium]|nr:thioredoxin family protein [Candidatus Peribacteraceae bacterium]MDD5740008.1 thioredoxin family protein [Candidatus Peribacteraceae bacterium]